MDVLIPFDYNCTTMTISKNNYANEPHTGQDEADITVEAVTMDEAPVVAVPVPIENESSPLTAAAGSHGPQPHSSTSSACPVFKIRGLTVCCAATSKSNDSNLGPMSSSRFVETFTWMCATQSLAARSVYSLFDYAET